jgi:LEA14-like dessication related protein
MKRIAMVAASAAILAGAGCSALGKAAFEQPVVSLKDVRVRGIGMTGGTLDVILNVYNPNQYRLDATRLTYRVTLGDNNVNLATGTVDSHFTVNDRDSTTVPIPVTFTYSGVGEAGRQILQMGAVTYKVTGDVTVGTVVGNFTVPYSSTGRFTTTGFAR